MSWKADFFMGILDLLIIILTIASSFQSGACDCNTFVWLNYRGSDQKQEMFLNVLCLFSVSYRFNQHLNLIATHQLQELQPP